MKSMFISMLPILIATFCLLFKKSTTHSMFFGTAVGIGIYLYLNGLSYQNICLIADTFLHTILDNTSVLISIFLLFILVFIIKNSETIIALNTIAIAYMNSPSKIIIAIIILGIVFSLDDYLSCMAIGSILTSVCVNQGFSKEKTAFLINITAVSCCCISPFSSWMPVIKSALSISGLNNNIVYQTLPFNFAALVGILFVILTGLFKPNAFKPNDKCQKFKPRVAYPLHKSSNLALPLIAFSIVFLALLISLILMSFIFTCSYPVIKSSALSIVIAIPTFLGTKTIKRSQIIHSIKAAYKSTLDLSILLLSIWLLTNICNNLLNMTSRITVFTTITSFPSAIIPAFCYIFSSIFAFFTGSSYGTFGLFIPLVVQLTNNSDSSIQIIAIAATIAGSLMASCSFASDTLKLTSESTDSNIKYLQFAQLPYGLLTFIICMISFFLAGVLASYGKIYSLSIPIIVCISLTINHFLILPHIYAIVGYRLGAAALIYIKSSMIDYTTIIKDFFSFHKYKQRSIYLEQEKILTNNLKIWLKTIIIVSCQTYHHKMRMLGNR